VEVCLHPDSQNSGWLPQDGGRRQTGNGLIVKLLHPSAGPRPAPPHGHLWSMRFSPRQSQAIKSGLALPGGWGHCGQRPQSGKPSQPTEEPMELTSHTWWGGVEAGKRKESQVHPCDPKGSAVPLDLVTSNGRQTAPEETVQQGGPGLSRKEGSKGVTSLCPRATANSSVNFLYKRLRAQQDHNRAAH
jgi:hypothetical protein